MAATSFELDDQSDEDFFDKLVDDDIDFAGSSAPSGVAEASAIAKLSISEVVSSKRVDFDENVGVRVTDSSGAIDNGGSSSDSKLESESGKVKLVQWNSFGSDSKIPGDGYGSDSDIFNALGESLDLPVSNEGVQSSVKEVALVESSVAYLGSSDEQRRENSGEPNVVSAGFGSYSDLFNGTGEISDDPFADVGDGGKSAVQSSAGNVALGSSDYEQRQEYSHELGENGQDLSSSQYWESAYPGWKYDQNTGQWYEVEGDAANMNENVNSSANLQESFSLSNSISMDQRTDSHNVEYPAHMVFDPQYPGWYYDTISQEWKSLDSYSPAVVYGNGISDTQQRINTIEQSYQAPNLATQESVAHWDASHSTYNQQDASVWQTQQTAQSLNIGYSRRQQLGNQNVITDHSNHSNHSLDDRFNAGFQSVNHQIKEVKSQERQFLPAQFNSLDVNRFASQSVQRQSSSAFSVGREERTSDKRPPHALVTFGFGGKLVVMKDHSSLHADSAYRTQDSRGDVINVLNLMEVVMEKPETIECETGDYFRELCDQSFPGPLVGGNAGSKELNKWIEEKISDYRDRDLSRLLLSLLKISVQYYGKLRSPFGNDQILKENDSPESAVAELFASAQRTQEYGAFTQCLQNIPSETQIQGIALEVQNLLVSGRKKEALERAQEGQLWGPALALSSQLGAEFYSDTMKKMALKHLVAGSPLRTLCLLIAGQPADVFSDTVPNSLNAFQQSAPVKANCTLEEWKSNLAIITANRTKDDELVIIHLGDCLWKDTGEITAAHICYLVAEANFEHHSESSRLCLIGADHWKFPRTYATPEAIQRTELYEYAKVLGNSQFLLLPFQPYKLVYAHMLAEVGRISDSLKYCQAMLKSLKTGRAPEMEAWRRLVLSLEERIKTHQQGGYGTNITSTKLVGKLLTFFDSTAHRVVGGLPPPVPSTMPTSAQHFEAAPQLGVPGQSAQPSPLLIPSVSMDPISASGRDDLQMPYKSNSEPDFSRSPRKAEQSKKDNSSNTREKTSASSGSRFGRLGSQLFQKTVGLVIRSRPDKQAKLGEPNSFYYDEKLKRWVEQGAEPPPKQEALEPPPTMTAFPSINGSPQTERFESVASPDMKTPSPNSSTPPIPPGSNQFSARSRSGARSRYVDTFNKAGGASSNLFRSPSTPAAKPAGGFTPKFFVPAAVSSSEATLQPPEETSQEPTATGNGNDSSPFPQTTESPTPIPPMAMQRFPSMDTIVAKGNSSVPPQARRRASWSGSLDNVQSPVSATPPVYMPNNPPASLPRNTGSFGDELHEVQL